MGREPKLKPFGAVTTARPRTVRPGMPRFAAMQVRLFLCAKPPIFAVIRERHSRPNHSRSIAAQEILRLQARFPSPKTDRKQARPVRSAAQSGIGPRFAAAPNRAVSFDDHYHEVDRSCTHAGEADRTLRLVSKRLESGADVWRSVGRRSRLRKANSRAGASPSQQTPCPGGSRQRRRASTVRRAPRTIQRDARRLQRRHTADRSGSSLVGTPGPPSRM